MLTVEYRALRPAYELYAAVGWLACGIWVLMVSGVSAVESLTIILVMFVFFLFVYRTLEAFAVLKQKRALLGHGVEVVSPDFVITKARQNPECLWVGRGFAWTREHAQRLYQLESLDEKRLVPEVIRMIFSGRPKKGSPLIHGVGVEEEDIYIPYSILEGHSFVPGTTGALKTRLLSLFALQAILRDPKRCVIIVDPKGDVELLNLIRWACRHADREDDFCYFHPAFPESSVRLDLMKNWTTTTEGASRVAEMMGGDSSSAPFKAFGWQVINTLIQAMLEVNERPQLARLGHYVESGPDSLLHRVIERYISVLKMDPDTEIHRYMGDARRVRGRSPTTPLETVAAVLYYKRELQPNRPSSAIDALLTMYEHDSAHFTKMIATLQPIMAMLTSDALRELLSPNYESDDPRELLDSARIIRQGRVFYCGLHSMPDPTVSSAIGSLFLADMVAVLGERYIREELTPGITMFLDEANEIVNPSLVSILNKGRGAGISVFFFTQSTSDFIAKYGDTARAAQLIANAGNVIFGRILDPETVKYAVDYVGETVVENKLDNYGVNPVADQRNVTNYHVSYGMKRQREREPLVRPEVFRSIPDLEYVAAFAGRKIYKGRIPVVNL